MPKDTSSSPKRINIWTNIKTVFLYLYNNFKNFIEKISGFLRGKKRELDIKKPVQNSEAIEAETVVLDTPEVEVSRSTVKKPPAVVEETTGTVVSPPIFPKGSVGFYIQNINWMEQKPKQKQQKAIENENPIKLDRASVQSYVKTLEENSKILEQLWKEHGQNISYMFLRDDMIKSKLSVATSLIERIKNQKYILDEGWVGPMDAENLIEINDRICEFIEDIQKQLDIKEKQTWSQKRYPKELIDAFGLENLSALPTLPNLVLKMTACSIHDCAFNSSKVEKLEGHKAAWGTTDWYPNNPTLSYIHDEKIVNIFSQFQGGQRNWFIMRGDDNYYQKAQPISDWSEIGKEFKAALALEKTPSSPLSRP